ncbi:hypothetical protein ARAM_005528 [Aspergillus rambellii]|uniref:FHA domain-containing protein n=1 Tax=Aspergillus rambellii TaxID=308745 RepID=A0A0F8X468_9EURO|nr:hypothetical protein ARAM_005528 [Aspergillus rambellii]
MSNRQAVVFLHHLSLPDVLPYRSLKFKSDSDSIDIGRASKRENKNLAPARNNGLFDSRVMSRTHATIHVSLEDKVVYIRDPGSMHGTWLNRDKIPVGEDVALSSGDVLTFGVEVVRGTDTFPPLAVRCECQWQENLYVDHQQAHTELSNPENSDADTQKSVQMSNTFCVPEDDDDMEITAHHPVPPISTLDRSSESNESAGGSDSEDSRSVVVVSSAMTSPLKNDAAKDIKPQDPSALTHNDRVQASCQSPLAFTVTPSGQPLATPRMTPPLVECDSGDENGEAQYYDEYFARSSDDGSIMESENWEVDEDEGDGEQDAVDDFTPKLAEHDAQVPERSTDAPVISETTETIQDKVDGPMVDASPQKDCEDISHFENSERNSIKDGPEHMSDSFLAEISTDDNRTTAGKIPTLDSQPLEQPMHSEASLPAMLPPLRWPLPPKPLPSAGFPPQPSGKLFDPSLTPFPTNTYSSMSTEQIHRLPRYSSAYDLMLVSEPCVPLAPYTDGPFANSQPGLGPPAMTTCQHPLAPYTDGPFANSQPGLGPPAMTTCQQNTTLKVPSMRFVDPIKQTVRQSCNALARKPTSLLASRGKERLESTSLKRKAAEIESEPTITAQSVDRDYHRTIDSSLNIDDFPESFKEETCLPDAQPHSLAAILNSDSQLTTISLPNSSKTDERPSKRAKTSNKGSLKSHAATAVIGAVVGAIGTIAALASLPPDYFV